MKITPLDLRHQEFTGALSGYSRREVRAFLLEVGEQLEQTLRDNQALKDKQDTLEHQIETLKQGEEELRRIVVSAERIAHELRQNAEKEAQLILREAEGKRLDLLAEGENGREAMMREARDAASSVQRDLERAKTERAQFISQYRGLLQGFMSLAERYDVGD